VPIVSCHDVAKARGSFVAVSQTTKMGELDQAGKNLLHQAAGSLFSSDGPSVTFSFGPNAGTARIDGTVAGTVAIEVESRVPKQIRGALLDLILHPYPSKLLVLLPVHTGNVSTAVRQAETILGHFLDPGRFRVVVVQGSYEESLAAIRAALLQLGVHLGAGPSSQNH
jgi:hypothetical protein